MIDTKTAYQRSVVDSNTYRFLKEKYLPQIDLKVFEAMDKGRIECTINLFSILGLKLFKYKETLLTVIFLEYRKLGYNVGIKRYSVCIDWITESLNQMIVTEEKETKEENNDDSSTGAPREIEADSENEDEAIFDPKPLKMHIGFRL